VSDWLGFGGAGVPAVDLPLTPVLLAGGLLFVFCLLVTWGLYLRLSFFYWLTIVLLLLGPLATVYGAAQAAAPPLLLFAVEAVLCLLALGFAFMAHDEFAWVERHLATVGRAVDKDVDSPSALYARGRKYAEQEMWARAAAHWSRAVALSPGHPEYRLALATAYVNLGQPERAVEHLDKAQEIEPGNRQARDLLASLQLDR
jgi:tetratricopeptide (TPR) repeat protein